MSIVLETKSGDGCKLDYYVSRIPLFYGSVRKAEPPVKKPHSGVFYGSVRKAEPPVKKPHSLCPVDRLFSTQLW